MKKIIIFYFFLLPFISFGQSWKDSKYSKWTTEVKSEFLENCIDGAGDEFTQDDRENYCICSLGRLMEQHSDPELAGKMLLGMTMEELVEYIEPCLFLLEE